MNTQQKESLIKTILDREPLRKLTRIKRLLTNPVRTFPYYIFATISHLRPFKISFKTLWGDTMTGFLPETNTFYYYGYCEANLTSFLLRFIRENSTFIDVGAHIGFYSMLTSHLVGENGKVYSFEPTPWTYNLLQKNTGVLKNVKTINAGASNSDGEISFLDYGPGYGAYNSSSIEGTILKFKPQKITTKMIELDSFFSQNSIIPDFIKLDAEGFEHKILYGMEQTLKNARPLITLEMAGGEQWVDNCRKSSEKLSSSNYESYKMNDDGFIEKCEVKPPYTYTNILFVPREKTSLVFHLIR